jgi:uncharacterized protein (TIGR00299 family) protein
MKIAYLDCFSGISGDMVIGAFLDIGVDFHALEGELRKLDLRGFELRQSRVVRTGIAATKFDVVVGAGTAPKGKSRSHHQADSRAGSAGHKHFHGEATHRSLDEILRMINASTIDPTAKKLAGKIFDRLGNAEAKVHGIPVERVHFHEVGAVDSIIDIVGSAICFGWMGFEKVVASPVNVGAGFVDCEHGRMPVPGPATAELLKGIPVFSAGPEAELTTPTGAAILSTVASEYRRLKDFKITSVGYGAGSREFKELPNTLRILVGEEPAVGEISSIPGDETVSVIEANIDDMNPQIYGYFLEKALAAGALEVFVTPVQMKKSRPGQWLTVICEPGKVDALTQMIFAETTTIGVRIHACERRILKRSFESIDTTFGKVRVKISRLNGIVLNAAPEFDDCQRLAQDKAVPLKEVLAEANAKIRSLKF